LQILASAAPLRAPTASLSPKLSEMNNRTLVEQALVKYLLYNGHSSITTPILWETYDDRNVNSIQYCQNALSTIDSQSTNFLFQIKCLCHCRRCIHIVTYKANYNCQFILKNLREVTSTSTASTAINGAFLTAIYPTRSQLSYSLFLSPFH